MSRFLLHLSFKIQVILPEESRVASYQAILLIIHTKQRQYLCEPFTAKFNMVIFI